MFKSFQDLEMPGRSRNVTANRVIKGPELTLVDSQSGYSRISNLATIVSRTLQSKDRRIRCPVDRNLEFFFTSHAQF